MNLGRTHPRSEYRQSVCRQLKTAPRRPHTWSLGATRMGEKCWLPQPVMSNAGLPGEEPDKNSNIQRPELQRTGITDLSGPYIRSLIAVGDVRRCRAGPNP